jgi:hypothetical protein
VADKNSVRQSTFQMAWAGSMVGEAEVLTGSPYRYTMVTHTDCQLLYIHRYICAFHVTTPMASRDSVSHGYA